MDLTSWDDDDYGDDYEDEGEDGVERAPNLEASQRIIHGASKNLVNTCIKRAMGQVVRRSCYQGGAIMVGEGHIVSGKEVEHKTFTSTKPGTYQQKEEQGTENSSTEEIIGEIPREATVTKPTPTKKIKKAKKIKKKCVIDTSMFAIAV